VRKEGSTFKRKVEEAESITKNREGVLKQGDAWWGTSREDGQQSFMPKNRSRNESKRRLPQGDGSIRDGVTL